MILYGHVDPRLPFLWEDSDQPPARWHDEGEGPVQHLADTPDGAWAEFLRHEGITEEADLVNVRRGPWKFPKTFILNCPVESACVKGGVPKGSAPATAARRNGFAGTFCRSIGRRRHWMVR